MGILTVSLLRAMRKPQFFQTVPIIVELEEGANPAALAANLQQTLGIETRQVLPMSNAFSVIAPTEMVNELAGIRYVKQIHLDRTMYAFQEPPLPPFGTLGDRIQEIMSNPQIMLTPNEGWIGTAEVLKSIGVYELHKRGVKGQGVKVWVLDTGVDITNPQLQGIVAGAHSTTFGTPADGNGHGTFCATEIAGQFYTEPLLKIDMLGVAPECELHCVKVLTDLGFGNTSDIMKGIELALSSGAQIISMSLGGESDPEAEETDPMVTLINKAAETHPQTTFIVAAGNSGEEGETAGSTVGTPANAANALTVGAVSLIDAGKRCYYSSTGPTAQARRTKPDICAPGGGLARASGYPKGMGDLYSGTAFASQLDPMDKLVNSCTSLKGTSMATPLVAGILSLWRQLVPQLKTEEIKKIFAKYSGRPQTNELGYGTIDSTWILQALGQAGA